MSKNEMLKVEGEVIDVLPSAMFKVKLDGTEHIITAYVSGRMRKHEIRILQGDRVEVEMSPYDLEKGRVVRRN